MRDGGSPVRLRPQLTVLDGDARRADNPRPAAGPSRLEQALPALVVVLTATALGTWAVIISQSRFEIRPEMMSYLLIQVILWLYATGRVVGRKRLWFLPVAMCLFANFHSLFIVGAVVIACHMAGVLLSEVPFLPFGWRRPVDPGVRSQVLTTGAAALAATIVNPFFLKGAFFPLTLMTELSGKQAFVRRIGELVRPFEDFFVT